MRRVGKGVKITALGVNDQELRFAPRLMHDQRGEERARGLAFARAGRPRNQDMRHVGTAEAEQYGHPIARHAEQGRPRDAERVGEFAIAG